MGHQEAAHRRQPVRAYLASLAPRAPRERRALRSKHDPRDTKFLETKDDVVRLFRALPEPTNIAYALSALAGLRPDEAIALEWSDVDLKRGRLTVRRSVRHGKVGTTKSGRARIVDLVPSLQTLLTAWREKTPGVLVVPSDRPTTKRLQHLGHSHSKIAADLTAALKA